MEKRLGTYLRTFRLKSGLTQEELSLLVGGRSASHISRIESGERYPDIALAIALSTLFQCDVPTLFPGLYRSIEEQVIQRAYALYLDLQGNPSRATKAKLDFLEGLPKRHAEGEGSQNKEV